MNILQQKYKLIGYSYLGFRKKKYYLEIASLRNDFVFTNVLGKSSLASQPTILIFINCLDEKAIASLNKLLESIFEKDYHPLMLFNGLNGDLIKTELREDSVYTSKNTKDF